MGSGMPKIETLHRSVAFLGGSSGEREDNAPKTFIVVRFCYYKDFYIFILKTWKIEFSFCCQFINKGDAMGVMVGSHHDTFVVASAWMRDYALVVGYGRGWVGYVCRDRLPAGRGGQAAAHSEISSLRPSDSLPVNKADESWATSPDMLPHASQGMDSPARQPARCALKSETGAAGSGFVISGGDVGQVAGQEENRAGHFVLLGCGGLPLQCTYCSAWRDGAWQPSGCLYNP